MKRKLLAVVLLAVIGAALIPFETSLQAEQKAAGFRATKLDLPCASRSGRWATSRRSAASARRSPCTPSSRQTKPGPIPSGARCKASSSKRRHSSRDRALTGISPHGIWPGMPAKRPWTIPSSPVNSSASAPSTPISTSAKTSWRRDRKHSGRLLPLPKARGTLPPEVRGPLQGGGGLQEGRRVRKIPDYVKRFYGYELAQCPGHEKEAYEYLRKRYEMGDKERLPSLINYLKKLENDLDVPEARTDKVRVTPALF